MTERSGISPSRLTVKQILTERDIAPNACLFVYFSAHDRRELRRSGNDGVNGRGAMAERGRERTFTRG